MDHHPGQSLQALRIRLGHKAKDIAPQLGISPSYYSEIERGKKALPSDPAFFWKLSAALGVADIIFDSGKKPAKISMRPMTVKEKGKIWDFIDREGADFFLRRLLSRLENSGSPVLDAADDLATARGKSLRPETESEFKERLNDLERGARHFFDDVSEITRLAQLKKPSDQSIEMLRGIAKSVKVIQPRIEEGFSRMLSDSREARRVR